PLCVMYLIAILGNCTILFVIKTTSNLHEPQYLFLSMLATTDLGLSLSTLPTVLNVFLLHHREIESAILLAMAFDQFGAIRHPLHYTVILTPARIIQMGLTAVIRTVMVMRLPFCKDVILSHCYCYHPEVMKLDCGPVRVNMIYGLSLVICSFAIDSMFIFISYTLILKRVLGIACKSGQLKALITCVFHVFTVFLFYVSLIVLALIHRFGKFTSPLLHVTMADLFLFLTPVLNPLVYSLKTKQIRSAVHKVFNRRNLLK
uniref:G-protein coupled receptors family 1 profile domain-containing protein n=1 Tax=Mandrillus leucophaeus TaxID=9568 RepID=A0A2K5YEM0_MANLE